MKKWGIWLLSMGMTVGLLLSYPLLSRQEIENRRPEVVRIWVADGVGEVLPWLKQAAAAYEKEHACKVYLRRASDAEYEKAELMPDAAVGWETGAEVAFRGYGLVVPDETAEKATPAPPSGLFQRPTQAPPAQTPLPLAFPEDLTEIAVPEGMQALLPDGYAAKNPFQELQQGKARAALLLPSQMAKLQTGYRMHPRGDFFVPIRGRALTEDGQHFVSFLRGEEMQRLLKKQQLFSWNPSLCLYGAEQEDAFLMELSRKNFPQ